MPGLNLDGARTTRPAASRRCVGGVRSIEGIDAETALAAEHNAFVVQTLGTYESLARRGATLGFTTGQPRHARAVTDAGVASSRSCATPG